MATDNEGLQAEIGITVAKIARQLADVETRMTRAAAKIEKKFNESNSRSAATFKKIDDASGRTEAHLKKLQGFLVGAFSARELQRYADGWTNAGNKIAAAAQSAGIAARSLSDINDIADDSRSSLEATASLYSKLLSSTAAFADSEADVALATSLVAKSFKAGGAAASEAEGAIQQLGQALSAGKLSGDELNSLLENAPILAQAIADAFGVTVGQLKKLGAEGALTSEKVFAAIIAAQPKIEAAFDATNATIGDGFTRLQNAMIEYVGLGNEATGASDKLIAALGFLADNIDLVVAAGLILLGRFLGPMATKILVQTAANARTAALGITSIGTAATITARGVGALKAVLAVLGGPIGLLITGLTILPGLIETTGEKVDAAQAAVEAGEAALDAYAAASKRAADEQEGLGGKVSAATQAIVNQTRAGLQRALEDAIKARDELVDSLSDGAVLNGKLRILGQEIGGFQGNGFGNEFLVEMGKAFDDLASGARTDLDVVVDRLQAIAGAGEELNRAVENVDLAKLDPQNVDLAGAQRELVELAELLGLFDEELAAIAASKNPDDLAKAFKTLEDRMREAAEAGETIRAVVDPATQELLETTVGAKDEVERLTAALAATGDELAELAAAPSPFEEMADDAKRVADELERINGAQREYGDSRMAGNEIALSDGMAAARAEIAKYEGYRSEPYWDVNHWRAGYGSDTGTNAQGQSYEIQKGVSISRADAERDLDRRIGEYFDAIIGQIGATRFGGLEGDQKASLASLLHNYGAGEFSAGGDLSAVLEALKAGNNTAVADAIGALATQNNGVNRDRRFGEAEAFGGVSGRVTADVDYADDQRDEATRAAEDRATELERENELRLELLQTQEKANALALQEAGLIDTTGASAEANIAAITRQRVEMELLNQAKEAGIDVDKELTASGETYRQAIERLAVAAGAAAEAESQAMQKREGAIERAQFLADTVGQISSGLASAFVQSLRSAENFRDGALNAISDVLAGIAEMIVQQTIYNAIAGALGLAPQTGGVLAALGLGTPGMAEGGYSGPGTKHEPAGVYHKGEYIVDADTVNKVGVPALEHMSATGAIPMIGSPLSGSSASLAGMAGGGASEPAAPITVAPAPIEVYPVLSEAALGQMVARPGVQRVVVDIIDREGFSRG